MDVLLSDDACKVLDRNTAENLAIIRRIVYNRLKMLSNGQPLKLGRYGCTFDRDFRFKILFSKLEAMETRLFMQTLPIRVKKKIFVKV